MYDNQNIEMDILTLCLSLSKEDLLRFYLKPAHTVQLNLNFTKTRVRLNARTQKISVSSRRGRVYTIAWWRWHSSWSVKRSSVSRVLLLTSKPFKRYIQRVRSSTSLLHPLIEVVSWSYVRQTLLLASSRLGIHWLRYQRVSGEHYTSDSSRPA